MELLRCNVPNGEDCSWSWPKRKCGLASCALPGRRSHGPINPWVKRAASGCEQPQLDAFSSSLLVAMYGPKGITSICSRAESMGQPQPIHRKTRVFSQSVQGFSPERCAGVPVVEDARQAKAQKALDELKVSVKGPHIDHCRSAAFDAAPIPSLALVVITLSLRRHATLLTTFRSSEPQ
jgi:hypothetical protein